MGCALFLLPTDVMGGAENVLRMTARAALESGRYERVTVFVLAGRRSGTLDELAAAGAEVVHSGASSEKMGLAALARTLRRERYAFVMSSHTHLNAAASAARRVGWLRTDRLATRESTMAFERDYGRIGPAIRGLYKLYGAQDRIVCQTERMRSSLVAHTADHIGSLAHHIPNPLDLARYERSDSERRRGHIVWCGRLAPVKSPERAIGALQSLLEMGIDARLTMIGDGELRDGLERHLADVGLSERAALTGRIERPERIMKSAEIGLVTSDVEGFPNVILEMLASGVRHVVTTDCAGGLSDIPGVTVVQDHTETALARALANAFGANRPGNVDDDLAKRSPEAFLAAIAA